MDEAKLVELIDNSNTEIQAAYAKAEAEIKSLGTVTQTTQVEINGIKAQLDQIRAEMLAPYRKAPDAPKSEKSFGERFTECDDFKRFRDRAWHKGGASLNLDGEPLLQKTTITTATVGRSTPGILTPERVGGIIGYPQRRLRVRDIIPWGTTTSDAVEFVKENAFTNAASPQTEASDKAESALTFTIAHAHTQTIAHWIPATSQVLADFGQLQAYINRRLLEGLADIEDYELLRGDGTGTHLSGLVTEATSYAGTYDAASDTRLDKLNHSIAELEAGNYNPTAFVLNPVDYRIIQVIKTNEGGANLGPYILGGPGAGLPTTVWGLPVALTQEMPVGKFLVGDFQTYCQGFDRLRSRIDISTEHSDYFIKNMVAIRAEERIALAVFRGTAFRYGTF